MFRIYKQNDNTQPYVTEYVADTIADVNELPTDVDPGSVCIVTEGTKVFMLNASREWVEI